MNKKATKGKLLNMSMVVFVHTSSCGLVIISLAVPCMPVVMITLIVVHQLISRFVLSAL